jgi:hypothetical protein
MSTKIRPFWPDFFGEWIFASSFASKRAKLARNLNTVRLETGAKVGQ